MAEDDDDDEPDDNLQSEQPVQVADAGADDWSAFRTQPATQPSRPTDEWAAFRQPQTSRAGDEWAAFRTGQQQPQQPAPKAESPFWTMLRQVAHNVLPTLAGAATGVESGAAAGAILGWPGAIAGGLIGGGIGGYAAATVQEAGAKALGFDDSQQLAANATANPWSSAIGGAATAAIPFGIGAKVPALARAGYAAITGGTEAASEYARGEDFDPRAIGLSALTGGALAQPRSFLTPLEAHGGQLGVSLAERYQRYRGTPAVAPHGTPGSDAAAGTAKEQPPPAGGTPGEGGAAAATPETTAPAGDETGPEDLGKEAPAGEPAPTGIYRDEQGELQGKLRLYRGETPGAGAAMSGSPMGGGWYTTDLAKAQKYGDVNYIDITPADLNKFAQGHGGTDEYVLPDKQWQDHFRSQSKPLEQPAAAGQQGGDTEGLVPDPALDAAIRAKMEPEGEPTVAAPEDRDMKAAAAWHDMGLDQTDRELLRAQLEARLNKNGKLTYDDLDRDLTNKLDTTTLAGLKQSLAENPRRALDALHPIEQSAPAAPAGQPPPEQAPAAPAAPSVAAEPVAPAPATPAIRKLGDIEIAKNPDGPGYVVRRGDDVLSEHDTLRQANAMMVKQANAASPADKALPSFYEQQKAQAQAQFAKEAVRRVGDIAIVKNPDGPGYVVMRGDDILSQHNNIGQAHLGLNRAVKQANLPLPPDEAFAPAPGEPPPKADKVPTPAEVPAVREPPRPPSSAEFRQAQADYRSGKIGDDEFLAARAKYEAAGKAFDVARGEAPPAAQAAIATSKKLSQPVKPVGATSAARLVQRGFKREDINAMGHVNAQQILKNNYTPAQARDRGLLTSSAPIEMTAGRKRGPAAKDEKNYNLLEYLASKGGLQRTPELTGIFGTRNPLVPGFGPLFRSKGMTMDRAWEAATREAPYITDSSDAAGRLVKSTPDDLLQLIEQQARGGPKVYREGSENFLSAGDRDRAAEANRVAIQRAVDGFSEDAGLGAIDPKIYDRTVEIMEKEGVSDPDVAYERALMEGADQYEKANKVRDDAVGHIEGWDVDDAAAAREAGRGIREAAAGPEPAGAPTFSDAGEEPRGAFEMGAEGKPQGVIPGAERIGEGELAQRRADERLRPTAPQRPADEGLFGDTHLQDELFTGGRDELMRQRLDAAEVAPSPAAHLRETAAMYRAQGQEGRARQLEKGADAIERSQQQQQQQQQQQRRQRPPPPPPGGTPPAGAPPPLGGAPPTQRPAPAPPARFPFLSKLLRAWQETFQPETISSNALRAEPVFAKMKSAQSGEHDRIFHETQEGEARWNKIPEADRFSFLSDVENGRTVKPEVKADAQHIRRMLDETDKLEKQWGSKAAYRDDYFPHEWEAPRPGQPPLMEYLTQTLGPTGFQKARTIDLIEQGIAGGYKLKNTNPYAAVRSRLLAGADMRMTMEMLGGLEKMQLAGKVKNDAQAATLAKQGWQKVNAPDREQWLISPEIQPIWNNVVAQRGLWGDPGVAGDAFRGWMQFKSAWVPIKLAVSAFHPLHVAHINMSSNLARAADQAIAGDINGAIKSAKQAVTTTFRPAAEVGGKPISAKEVQNQWLLGENARTPEGKLAVQYMEEGGIIPRAPEQFRSAAEQRLSEAWQAGNPFKLAYYAPQELVRRIQAPIFDMWIPRVKIASYLNDAAALMKRRPDLVNNDEARGIALRALGKSTDNRYGEMFYNGLFWNKMTKDLGTGSLLSLGWNLGFAREFGGAAIEAATRPAGKFIPGMAPSAERQIIRDATNKIKFASIYMGTAAMIGGVMTKMFTGEDPKDTNDYIFPRVGGLNPDGSPRRLTTMFYLREIPMLQKHVQEQGGGPGGMLGGAMSMLWNKTLFQPIRELAENRDYFGREVWDTNAPGYQQIAQAVRHTFGQQLSPMSVTSAERAQETGGRPIETPLAFLGFGPAPAYAARTALQNRIGYLYQNYVAPGAKPYQDDATTHDQQVARNQILLAKQNHDPSALSAARADAKAAGMKPKSVAAIGKEASDQYMFKRLPQPHQMAILSEATPDERQRYWRDASAATKMQWKKEHPSAAVQ